MASRHQDLTPQKIQDYCDLRLAAVLPSAEVANLCRYLTALLERGEYPPYLDTRALAEALGINASQLSAARAVLKPIFDAVSRAVTERRLRPPKPPRIRRAHPNAGRKARLIEEFPVPLQDTWEEPRRFGEALRLHAARHGETTYHLYNAVVRPEDGVHRSTLISWGKGQKAPRSAISLEILKRIERRYRLPDGYFASKRGGAERAPGDFILQDVTPAERRRLAWHLPEDFNNRPRQEQVEIVDWVRRVIVSGSTDYRRYQAVMMRQRYAVRFACVSGPRRKPPGAVSDTEAGIVDAPARLNDEMAELLRFKTSTFAAFGLQRNGVWGEETATQKADHFGLWFGAFAAPAESEVRGFGADPQCFTFAMMVFPQVWDWYLQWRERRRGFYTKWEIDLLSIM